MQRIKLVIQGVPIPKQSARFYGKNVGGKVKIMSYQKAEIKANTTDIKSQALSLIPHDFKPFEKGIGLSVTFIFPPPKSMSKSDLKKIENGEIVYKTTSPDLHDNLKKNLIDSLHGIIFTNDSRICYEEKNVKIYGLNPRTEVS